MLVVYYKLELDSEKGYTYSMGGRNEKVFFVVKKGSNTMERFSLEIPQPLSIIYIYN